MKTKLNGTKEYPFNSAPFNSKCSNKSLARDSEFASHIIYPTKVQRLLKTCGVRMTALYLRNRGYTAEQAVTLMFR